MRYIGLDSQARTRNPVCLVECIHEREQVTPNSRPILLQVEGARTHYLVATVFDYDDPRLFPLHRFSDAKMLGAKLKAPQNFSLDKFIEQGELSYRIGDEEIEVELLFDRDAGRSLEETPLSHKQSLTARGEKILVKARVPETQVLRSWLLGFGPKVQVLKPPSLRRAIADAHREAATLY